MVVAQKTIMLLCHKTSSASRLCSGGLDAMDRKTLKTGMLIVHDPKTHIEFMVDSDSRRFVIPCHRPATHPSVTGLMSCLNGSEVLTFESVDLELALNLGRPFTWTFVKADVVVVVIQFLSGVFPLAEMAGFTPFLLQFLV